MTHVIPVVSDQEMSARVFETLKVWKDASWGDSISFRPADGGVPGQRILVFGKLPEGFDAFGAELIYTYSYAQVLTKANAVSVLDAAIRNMINGPVDPDILALGWGQTKDIDFLMEATDVDYDQPITIDIETDGILGDTHTPDEVRPFSVAVYQDHWDGPITFVSAGSAWNGSCVHFSDSELETLAHFLARFKYSIYHNGKFDTRVLNRVFEPFGVRLNVWFDTMLAHHVLNHSAGAHGLKELARLYFAAPDWEAGMKQALGGSKDYSAMSIDAVRMYNGWDVVWTMELFKYLKPLIEADEAAQTNLYFEQQVAEMFLDIERTGIPLDEQYIEVYGQTLQGDMDEYKRILAIETGKEGFNPNSPKQIKDWFMDQGLELQKTDEANLKEVSETYGGSPESLVATLILSYREASKRKGTYVDGWSKRARNGRVHPSFLVHGTRTGRISSTGPNAQNMPREKAVRKIVG